MIAYHNDTKEKADILEQLRQHREADELVQDYGYWADGKGCAVGCTLHSGNHCEYEHRFGIPQPLAHIEDAIFEQLPVEWARRWPERFMGAIQPGADLSLVAGKLLHWLLTTPEVNPGIVEPEIQDAVLPCVQVLESLTRGEFVDVAAALASRRFANHRAGFSPTGEDHWSDACASAASAALCAAGVAGAAGAAVSLAIEGAVEWSLNGYRSAVLISDKLIELIRQAPIGDPTRSAAG